MNCVEINQFLLRWRIKNILYADFLNDYEVVSPRFEAKTIGDSKWRLYMRMRECRGKELLEIALRLNDFDDESVVDGKLFLNFKFKLLSSDGKFPIATSVLNYTFEKRTASMPDPLIEKEELFNQMRGWSEDTIIVMCYMEHANNAASLMVSETHDIDWEAETILENYSRSFDCCFRFNNCDNWTESKRIVDLNITYELSLKYANADRIIAKCLPRMDDNWEHSISCCIELIGDSDEKITSIDERRWFINNKNVFFRDCISKQQLEEAGCFTNNEIKLSVEFRRHYCKRVIYSKNKNNSEIKSAAAFNTCRVPHLQRDLENLLVDKYFADVKLRVDNEIFPVHKGILASRSPVFLAMFSHDMVESNTGIVDIYDVDTGSMKVFLEFMYTGEMREIDEEMAMRMIMLADKYHVTSLKEVSYKFLMSVLSANNACNILSVADLVNCDDLKLSAVECIAEHSRIILSSSEWSTWTKDNFALATEVFLRLSNKFSNS